jgi:hypothetical protein
VCTASIQCCRDEESKAFFDHPRSDLGALEGVSEITVMDGQLKSRAVAVKKFIP